MQPIDEVKIALAAGSSEQSANHHVARAQPVVERSQVRLRFDDDPSPAALVEPERHVVSDRMAGADVDIDAGILACEREREMVVLEILRV